MKTRFAYITLSVIAALVLSSCDKNDQPRDFEANLTINLGCNDLALTKTTGTDTDTATASEKAISSVRIFLVPASSTGVPSTSEPVVELANNLIKIEEDATGSKVARAKVFKTNGYTQLVYVLVNCSSLTVDLTNYSKFIGSYLYQTLPKAGSMWATNNFTMVNSVDANVSKGDVICNNGGVLVDFQNQNNTASITLERVCAKVVADQSDFIDFAPYLTKVYGTSATSGYVVSSAVIKDVALFNCVNSFYFLQTRSSGYFVTPSSVDTYPVPTKTTLACDGYYFTEPEVNKLTWVAAGTPMYCLENNPNTYAAGSVAGKDPVTGTKMMGRTTAVIFRAQLKLSDGFEAGIDITEPIGEDGPGSWKTKGTYQNDIVKTIYKYKGVYYADASYLLSKNTELGSDSSTAALRALGVKVFEDGYMYYTYWISDPDKTTGKVPFYSVERNRCYNLTVESVSAFGDDLPCGGVAVYDPADPIDKAKPRMNVDITVLPWGDVKEGDYEIAE